MTLYVAQKSFPQNHPQMGHIDKESRDELKHKMASSGNLALGELFLLHVSCKEIEKRLKKGIEIDKMNVYDFNAH